MQKPKFNSSGLVVVWYYTNHNDGLGECLQSRRFDTIAGAKNFKEPTPGAHY